MTQPPCTPTSVHHNLCAPQPLCTPTSVYPNLCAPQLLCTPTSVHPSRCCTPAAQQPQQPPWLSQGWQAEGVLQHLRAYLLGRLFEISPTPCARCLHFNGICWDFWEKQPQPVSTAAAAPKSTRLSGLCHIWDRAAFTALSLLCIPSGRNPFHCLLPFLQGHQGRMR